MEPGDHNLPRPYLTRAATDARLTTLGFNFHTKNCLYCGYPPNHSEGMLISGQERQLQAMMDLIAGAIAEWADVKDDFDEEGGSEAIDQELQTWAQEWLVG